MFEVRRRFKTLAALVLLVWLFAFGAAIAKQVCTSHGHSYGDDCCVTMHEGTLRAETPAMVPAQAQPDLSPPLGAMPFSCSFPAPQHASTHRIASSRIEPGQRIPIVLLRLAL
jgi:hypothetical protein